MALGFQHNGDLRERARETCRAARELRDRCRTTRAVSMELRLRAGDRRAIPPLPARAAEARSA